MTAETIESPTTEQVTDIGPIEALRLGRLTRPIEYTGMLFAGTDKACAIGAMALGFGYKDPGYVSLEVPDVSVDEDEGDQFFMSAYTFVASKIGVDPESDLIDAPMTGIWEVSDGAKEGQRDEEVIKYLRSIGFDR